MQKMALFAAGLLLAGGARSQLPGDNNLTPEEKQKGWRLLFDGQTTKGWHVYHRGSDGHAWKAEDGELHLNSSQKSGYQTKDGGDLITDAVYGNYDLKLDWKISPGGNSGVLFDVQEDPKYPETWNTGPEMQVLDNERHGDGKIQKHRAGDLYDLIASSTEPVKPVGEWNQVEIRCLNGKLDLFMNQVKIVSTTLWDDAWWKLVAASKFRDMPGFSKSRSGHFALQDHGFDVWFKNIKIKAE
jgi:hypothetical protein